MITRLTDENKKQLVRSVVAKKFKNRKKELKDMLDNVAQMAYVKGRVKQLRSLPNGFFKEIVIIAVSFESLHNEYLTLSLPKSNRFPITYAKDSGGDLIHVAPKGSGAWMFYRNYLEHLAAYHTDKSVFTKELEAFLSQFVTISSIVAAWPPIAPFMQQFGYHREQPDYGTNKLNNLWGVK